MNKKTLVAILAIAIVGAIGVVKLFGETVHEKYDHANDRVVSEVHFGGPSDSVYHYRPPARRAHRATPNLAPPDQKFQIQQHQAAPSIPAGLDRFSTFALDVDTGSYTYARRQLREGRYPEVRQIRLEEFVNAMPYSSHQIAGDGVFGVDLEASPSPWTDDARTRILRVKLKAHELEERAPLHLTFLVDVSGSMDTPDRLPLAKEAIRVAASKMRSEDTVSIVTYSGNVEVALPPVSARERDKIARVVDGLGAGGSTAMGSGMELAYRQAAQTHRRGHVSRVVVLSDGDANIGPVSSRELLGAVKSYVDDGITLSTVGFGMGNYRDGMMEQLANSGDGNYQYIDSQDEVLEVFGEKLERMAYVAAEEVKAQMEFDPEVVESWRQLGYENRQIADADFRNDAVDAGEVGPGHTVTALYEVTLKDDHLARVLERDHHGFATLRLRYRVPGEKVREVSYRLEEKNSRSSVAETSSDHRTALAAGLFADVLRHHLSEDYLSLAHSYAEGGNVGGRELVELIRIVQRQSS